MTNLMQMVHLFKDPEGETVLEPSSATDNFSSSTSKSVYTSEFTNNQDVIADLRQQISELKEKYCKGICS
jgi:hypothetical protein